MADTHYGYTIERAESGRRICGVISSDTTTGVKSVAEYVCKRIFDAKLPTGDITDLRIQRRKDGSVFISALGAMDRIFAVIRKVDEEWLNT